MLKKNNSFKDFEYLMSELSKARIEYSDYLLNEIASCVPMIDIRTTEEKILDNIDPKIIESYLRKKKLKNIDNNK